MRAVLKSTWFLVVAICLTACQPGEFDFDLDSGVADGLDASEPVIGQTQQALETSLCGNVSGLQASSPWPMFGGCPTHAAQSSVYGPGTNLKNWQTAVSSLMTGSAVQAADGSIYIGAFNGPLYKLNPTTGAILKTLNLGGVRGTPAIGADGTIYIGSDNWKMNAVNPTTFAIKWSYQGLGRFGSSAAVAPDGTVYVGSEDFELYALNPTNGAKKWSYRSAGGFQGSPAIGTDGTIYIGGLDWYVYAINPNGTLKWKKALGYGIQASPAVGRSGRIFIAAANTVYALDPANGNIIWQKVLAATDYVTSAAVGANGVIYVGTGLLSNNTGSIQALTHDGDLLWTFGGMAYVESVPTIDRAGDLFVGDNNGNVYSISPSGTQNWKYVVGSKVQSSPLISASGAVIFGAFNNNVYSVGVGAPRKPQGEICDSDAACDIGLVCGSQNGARFGKPATANVCWSPTCENRVKDPGETEVDCGGACGTCTNVCGLACTVNVQVTPPALEVLSFNAGTYIRASLGSYLNALGNLEISSANRLRFDRALGGGRLALFEGERTNRLLQSEQLQQTPQWTQSTAAGSFSLLANFANALNGILSASRLIAPAGGYPSPKQTIATSLPAGVLSTWLRLTDPGSYNSANPLKTRAVLVNASNQWFSDPSAWNLPPSWERRTLKTQATTGAVDVLMSHKAGWPGSASIFPQLPAADFLAWGFQLEEGAFASSYIPTTLGVAKRLADRLVYESSVVPAWVRTGLWQVDVAPTFASAEAAVGDEFTVVSWEGGQLSLLKTSIGGQLKITTGAASTQLALEWAKAARLTFSVDMQTRALTVSGALSGNGTFGFAAGITIPVGRLAIGARFDGTKAAFSLISEIRRVATLSVACTLDLDCVACGDGQITGTEQCDTLLDPGCNATCTGPITNASTELSCIDGADNDADGQIDCADAVDCNLHPACRAPVGQGCEIDYDCGKGLLCVTGACRAPTCQNGAKDPGEQGTDCGGPCAPCNGLQCENLCRVGEPTTATSLESLSFASGAFSRPTTSTTESYNGQIELGRINELRWMNRDGLRLALFEGAGTNALTWSEALDHAPQWSVAPDAPMSVQPNEEVAPDMSATAERLSSLDGAGRSPAQTAPLPASRSAISAYILRSDPSDAGAQSVRAVASLPSGSIEAEWQLEETWERVDMAVEGAAGAATTFLFTGAEGYPTEDIAGFDTPPFRAWGTQLEGQPFPTSYIPTTTSSASRGADKLTFASVPAWVGNGRWQVDVAPLFASSEMLATHRYTVASFSNGDEIAFLNTNADDFANLFVRFGGATYTSPNLLWPRGSLIELTIDALDDRIGIDISDGEGTGSYPVAGLGFATSSSLRVGGAWNGQNEAYAGIGELRRTAAATSTCTADAACTCGNGVLDPGEVCEPSLNARCRPDCQIPLPTTGCTDNTGCATGSVCGAANGQAFGLGIGERVCWPAICETAAASHCGVGAACGACFCVPSCANATCGGSTSDGCGGVCAATCADRQTGCKSDQDCGSASACGEAQGASFGLAAGTNVCWPVLCEDPIQRSRNCGTASSPCGVCPSGDQCDGRACGEDLYGNSCGSCSGGDVCSASGQCVALGEYRQHLPPDPAAQAALEDIVAGEAGSLNGTFTVDASGSATYKIPLELPPGRAGMTPQLAVEYVSSNGDGYVGKGWSLTGLSAITRCPKTFAQHGHAAGVSLTSRDAFCLDGKLLVRTGTNEYRTEIDAFVRVRSFGDDFVSDGPAGEFNERFYVGPEHFEVWTKDGHKLTYGLDPNSRVMARFDGRESKRAYPVNVSWMLESIADTSGNSIDIRYDNQSTTRNGFEYSALVRPHAILYGSTDGSQRRSNAVVIHYADNKPNWAVRSYRGGVGKHFSSPISSIDVQIDGENVRNYVLESQMVSDTWQLKSIKSCVPTTAGQRCMPATTFQYNDVGMELHRVAKTTDDAGEVKWKPNYKRSIGIDWEPDNANDWALMALDHDGDGRQDLLHSVFEGRGYYLEKNHDAVNPDRDFLYLRRSKQLANGSAFVAFDKKKHVNKDCFPGKVADFNHDGREDFLAECYDPINSYDDQFDLGNYPSIVTSTEDGFEVTDVSILIEPLPDGTLLEKNTTVHAIDVDGDGWTDLVTTVWQGVPDTTDLRLLYYRNQGGNFSLARDQAVPDYVFCGRGSVVVDHDGDGVENLICTRSAFGTTAQAYALTFDGQKFLFDPIEGHPAVRNGMSDISLLDANGDGLMDIATFSEKDHIAELYLSTGHGFESAVRFPLDIPWKNRWQYRFVVDLESDGRHELLIPDMATSSWTVHRPYDQTSTADAIWTTDSTAMPFFAAHLRKKKTRRYPERNFYANHYQAPLAFDWNGDGVQEVVSRIPRKTGDIAHPVFDLWEAGSRRQGLLSTITDGFGKRLSVTYSEKPVGYVKGQCQYPQKCLDTMPFPVVAAHSVYGTVGTYQDPRQVSTSENVRSFEYTYEDARVDLRGRGWLGFGKRTVKEFDTVRLLKTSTYTYDNATHLNASKLYPFAGFVTQTETIVRNSGAGTAPTNFRTLEVNDWVVKQSASGRPFVAVEQRGTIVYEQLEGASTPTIVSHEAEGFSYDGHGNRVTAVKAWGDGRAIETETRYVKSGDPGWSDYEAKWLVGLIKDVTVTGSDRIASNDDRRSYRIEHGYDGDFLRRGLPSEVRYYADGSGTPEQTTEYTYDLFANERTRRLSGRDATAQEYTTVYDSRAMFPIELHNGLHDALSLNFTQVGIDARNGQTAWTVGGDGSWSVTNYDGFGRVGSTTSGTGAHSSTSYASGGALGGTMTVTTVSTGQPTVQQEYNSYGGLVATRTTDWNPLANQAETRISEHGYDYRGRLVAQGVPHLSTTPSLAAHYLAYDNVDRVVREEHPRVLPNGQPGTSITTHAWWSPAAAPVGGDPVPWAGIRGAMTAHRSIVDDDVDLVRTLVSDARGHTVGSLDGQGGLTTYADGAFDHQRSVNVLGDVTVFQTDELGRVLTVQDPDIGTTEVSYDGLGLLRTSRKNAQPISRFWYDALGRVTSATTPDGTYGWAYDGNGASRSLIGKLEIESLVSSSIGNSSTTYAYDNPNAQSSSIARVIDGESFTDTVSMDALGRPEVIGYQVPGKSYAVRMEYEPMFGRARRLVENDTNDLLWTVEGIDAFGNTSRVRFGNGVVASQVLEPTTGLVSSLSYLDDEGANIFSEQLTYNSAGFAQTRRVTTGATQNPIESFEYDALGRLSWHHVGNTEHRQYVYDAKGNLRSKPGIAQLKYEGSPHQVTGTDDGRVFGYTDGNQTSRSGPGVPDGSQIINYTTFDLPSTVTSGNGGSAGVTSYHYDASNTRTSQARPDGSKVTYAGDAYVRTTTPGQADRHVIRVPGPLGAPTEVELGVGTERSHQYFAADRLGSSIAASDDDGAIPNGSVRIFDAFGQQTTGSTNGSRFGFTGHESDAELGLINMRGRMYDPMLGRFLSADPFVPEPDDSQSWNPYSYVRNNPINRIDPTGFQDATANELAGARFVSATILAPAAEKSSAGANSGQDAGSQPNLNKRQPDAGTRSEAPSSAQPGVKPNAGAAATATVEHTTPHSSGGGALLTASPLNPVDKALSFTLGALEGAAKGYAFGLGLQVAIPAIAAAGPVVIGAAVLVAAAAATAAVCALANGGAAEISGSVTRTWNGTGNETDFNVTGNLFGGLISVGGIYKGLSSGLKAVRGSQILSAGAERVAKFSRFWQKASLEKAISRHAGPNATSWVSETGKTIIENPATGRQVVVDSAGYFRIFQPKAFGSAKGTYLDMLGNVPNPRGVAGAVLKDLRQQATHFLIE